MSMAGSGEAARGGEAAGGGLGACRMARPMSCRFCVLRARFSSLRCSSCRRANSWWVAARCHWPCRQLRGLRGLGLASRRGSACCIVWRAVKVRVRLLGLVRCSKDAFMTGGKLAMRKAERLPQPWVAAPQ